MKFHKCASFISSPCLPPAFSDDADADSYATVVMGASFRNKGELLALAGCDKLTIGPQFLEELKQCAEPVVPVRCAPASHSYSVSFCIDLIRLSVLRTHVVVRVQFRLVLVASAALHFFVIESTAFFLTFFSRCFLCLGPYETLA